MKLPDWMTEASCTSVDPDLFFPTDHDRPATTAQAIAICGNCPVRRACETHAMTLETGLGYQYRHGIAGGLTPKQRVQLAALWEKSGVAA